MWALEGWRGSEQEAVQRCCSSCCFLELGARWSVVAITVAMFASSGQIVDMFAGLRASRGAVCGDVRMPARLFTKGFLVGNPGLRPLPLLAGHAHRSPYEGRESRKGLLQAHEISPSAIKPVGLTLVVPNSIFIPLPPGSRKGRQRRRRKQLRRRREGSLTNKPGTTNMK
jgi:hypothetical protein